MVQARPPGWGKQEVAVRRLTTADYYQVVPDFVGNMNENAHAVCGKCM